MLHPITHNDTHTGLLYMSDRPVTDIPNTKQQSHGTFMPPPGVRNNKTHEARGTQTHSLERAATRIGGYKSTVKNVISWQILVVEDDAQRNLHI